MRKKQLLFAAVIAIQLMLAAGCGNKDNEAVETDVVTEPAISAEETSGQEEPLEEAVPEVVEEVPSHDGEAVSSLTGLWIDEEKVSVRPFAVMINNLKEAMPQSGIADADIIYEAQVEGAINRLMAVYQSFDETATKIGPVRSARHYYLDMSFDFDSIYVHYGKSPQAKDAFSTLNAAHLDGLSYLDAVMFYQDPKRVRPHSTYTSYDGLFAGLERVGYRQEINPEKSDKLIFAEENTTLASGASALKVNLSYSWYSKPWFEYDEESGKYLRFQYGNKQIDIETGEQLAFANIIVQFTDTWNIRGDTAGRLDMDLVSSGEGYYISAGKYIPITWEKTSHESPTHYYNESGDKLVLNPGKTWISIFPLDGQSNVTIE